MSSRVEAFRSNHRDPANLAMHAAGFVVMALALKRLFQGRVLHAVVLASAGLGLLVGGHRIEGSDAFSMFRPPRP